MEQKRLRLLKRLLRGLQGALSGALLGALFEALLEALKVLRMAVMIAIRDILMKQQVYECHGSSSPGPRKPEVVEWDHTCQ